MQSITRLLIKGKQKGQSQKSKCDYGNRESFEGATLLALRRKERRLKESR